MDANENKLLFPPENGEVELIGGFFLLSPGSDAGEYRVASSNGTILFSAPERPEVADVGQGYVSVASGNKSIVYNADGEEALPLSSLDENWVYAACDNFMLAANALRGFYQIFNLHTGEMKWALYPEESTVISVYYAGGNDFIIVYDKEVAYDQDYDVRLQISEGDSLYMKQTVSRITIGVDTPRSVSVNGYIASLTNKYAFGKTEKDRQAYLLNDGYFTMGIYNVTDKVADGTIRYVVTDQVLNVLTELPDGIRPDSGSTTDGYFLSGLQSPNVRLFNDRLESILTFSDGPYHSAFLSEDVIILSKLSNGAVVYTAFDREGGTILDHNYSYLSEFISGKAIGVREGESYLVGKDGKEEYLSEDPLPNWWDGYYEYREGDRVGLRSYNGTTLTPADYETVDNYTRHGDTVYVAMKIGNAVDVYKLQ